MNGKRPSVPYRAPGEDERLVAEWYHDAAAAGLTRAAGLALWLLLAGRLPF